MLPSEPSVESDLPTPVSESTNDTPSLPPNLVLGPSEVDVEIEPQRTGGDALGNLFARAEAKLRGDEQEEEERPQRRTGGRRKRERDEMQASLTALLATGLTMLVIWTMGEEIAPHEDEADAIAKPLARVINRHFPITGRLSEDALDLITAAGAILVWYKRVAPVIAAKSKEAKPAVVTVGGNGAKPDVVRLPSSAAEAFGGQGAA